MSEDQEQPKNFYHSLNEEKNDNLKGYSEAMDKTKHSVAGFYSNVEDNTSVRPPFARKHYERFRPGEAIPNDDSEIMLSCREAYEKVGLIRSVVDLMTEIAIDGISIVSTNDSTEKFFKSWAKKVNLEELAEKFANYFIVEGNVSVRRKLDTIDVPSVRRMKREPAVGQELDESQIPMEYIFYDPSTLELIGGELAIFAGVRRWGLKVSGSEVSNLRQLATEGNKDLLKSLPKEVRSLLTGKNSSMAGYKSEVVIPIPEDQIYVAHYKKKDSDIWAKSFIYSILHDVIYNEKLRMAKISALDSWYGYGN